MLFHSICDNNNDGDIFVVTERYKELFEAVHSRRSPVVTISGPRGVGKSLALGAIATEYYRTRPCLYLSPIWLHQTTTFERLDFNAALEEIYIEQGKWTLFYIINH